jgi:predicted pyridoxine 5'-phosphate oxidase superfamily flavin-nucleotide-binding protein
MASTDAQAQVWAFILTGEPPFIHSLNEHTVHLNTLPSESDPLLTNLNTGARVGLLAIEFASRQRMRLNGTVERLGEAFRIRTEQVYSNCPKYIQARTISERQTSEEAGQTAVTNQLSTEQMKWISETDTFFIASAHPDGGADASHRGGNRGFVNTFCGLLNPG